MAYLQERENIKRQVKSYWYIDGLTEISGGISAALGGISFPLAIFLTSIRIDPFKTQEFPYILLQFSPAVPIFLNVIVGYILSKLVPKIRERITFPRRGFVDYTQQPVENVEPALTCLVLVIFVGFICLLPVVSLILLHVNSFWISLFGLILIPSLYTYASWEIAHKLKLPRFYISAAISLILEILFVALLVSGVLKDNLITLPLYITIMGLVSIVVGTVTLRRYLRKYSALKQEEE